MSVSRLTVVADLECAERGRGEGLGNQGYLEPLLGSVAALTALTVSETPLDGDRALVGDEGREVGGEGEAQHAPGAALDAAEQRADYRRRGPARCGRRGASRRARHARG